MVYQFGNAKVWSGTEWLDAVGGVTFGDATGGSTFNATVDGIPYKFHAFTSSANLEVLADGKYGYILIAGGGAGGGGYSSNPAETGGGGGGGVLFGSMSLVAGTYPIVIGAGGAPSFQGQNTTFNGKTAIGGGSGARANTTSGTQNGGSGGGGTGTAGLGTDGQGRDGGPGASLEGGGGGGFGGRGGVVNNTPAGDGIYLGPWMGTASGYGLAGLSFTNGWFAGGGGTRSVGRGFGTDSVYAANATSTAASANTGGGGAGSYGSPGSGQTGSAGGSGIAFIYYEVEA